MKSLGLGAQDLSLQFCSDNDPHCLTFLRYIHKPKIMYSDITKRAHHLAPHADMYFAGFPCQAWSAAGLGKGWKDKRGGPVFQHVQHYIQEKQPKCFILENVPALAQRRHMKVLAHMLTLLRKPGYLVAWRVLNCVHFGLPQNRPRLFIIGFHKGTCPHARRFRWPRQCARPPPVSSIICGGDVIKTVSAETRSMCQLAIARDAIKEKYEKGGQQPFVIDVWGRRPRAWRNVVPCLTRRMASDGGYYYLPERRLFTLQELCRLQGLPTTITTEAKKLHLPNRALAAMLGNAIPMPVLRAVIRRALHVLCHKP